MARKSQSKRRNGKGESISVFFDDTDPMEAAALKMAQLLASKHGRRKDAIIALLAALQQRYEQTGELLSSTDIANAITSMTAPPVMSMGFTPALRRSSTGSTPAERQPRGKKQRTGEVEISHGSKSTSETVARNFLSSMKGLASGFFD